MPTKYLSWGVVIPASYAARGYAMLSPMMIAARSQAQDGRIHTGTKAKFITCLLYLNEWSSFAEAGQS